jgi:hypothetical protein
MLLIGPGGYTVSLKPADNKLIEFFLNIQH